MIPARVPLLHGGWWDPEGHLVWVQSLAGKAIGRASAGRTSSFHMGAQYIYLARERPLALAKAWLRCFRSFSELGGFVLFSVFPRPERRDETVPRSEHISATRAEDRPQVLTDFKPPQFVLDRAKVEIVLVGGGAGTRSRRLSYRSFPP